MTRALRNSTSHEMAFFASLQFLWHFKGRDALAVINFGISQTDLVLKGAAGESEHQFIQWSLNSTNYYYSTAHGPRQQQP